MFIYVKSVTNIKYEYTSHIIHNIYYSYEENVYFPFVINPFNKISDRLVK